MTQRLDKEFEGGVDSDVRMGTVSRMTADDSAAMNTETALAVPITENDLAIFFEGNGWQLTETGLVWPDRDVDETEARRAGRGIAKAEKMSRYAVGDYIRGLEHRFGEKYKTIAAEVGLHPRFLANLVLVTGKVPVENRAIAPTVSHSRIVADFEPDKQKVLLTIAAETDDKGDAMGTEAFAELAKRARKNWDETIAAVTAPPTVDGETPTDAAPKVDKTALAPFAFKFRPRQPREKLDDYIAAGTASFNEAFKRYYDKKYDAAQQKAEDAKKEADKLTAQKKSVLEMVNALPENRRDKFAEKIEKAKDIDALNAVRASVRGVEKDLSKIKTLIDGVAENDREQFERMRDDGRDAEYIKGKINEVKKAAENDAKEKAKAESKKRVNQIGTLLTLINDKRAAAESFRTANDTAKADELTTEADTLQRQADELIAAEKAYNPKFSVEPSKGGTPEQKNARAQRVAAEVGFPKNATSRGGVKGGGKNKTAGKTTSKRSKKDKGGETAETETASE